MSDATKAPPMLRVIARAALLGTLYALQLAALAYAVEMVVRWCER